MEKQKTPLKQLLEWINYKYPETVITANGIRHKIEELLSEERKMVEGAFDKSRERINHPDWDYIYDDFKDFFDQTYEQ